MGTTHSPAPVGLADALFSKVQQRVLALLFGQADRRFQSAELIRLARGGTGAAHRQLADLESSGLVTVTRSGNQKYYQANASSPVFDELQGLIVKTVGLAAPLARALASLRKDIHAAFVFGSLARGSDTASSDIDLMVISDSLHHADLYRALQRVEKQLGRQVNPVLMTRSEWRAKAAAADSFAARVASQPRTFIVGSAVDLA